MKSIPGVLLFLIAMVLFLVTCQNKSNNAVTLDDSQSGRKKVAEFYYPVVYDSLPSADGQWGFQTWAADRQLVKLIPHIQNCESLGLGYIDSIFGVNQFLLDMDLTNGFVHRYTVNFYNRLSSDEFVLKYENIAGKKWQGVISFIRKKEALPTDTLGKNLAYFRQWRLSEILKNDSVNMQPCAYAKSCLCPQANGEIAIANCGGKAGKQPFTAFDNLSNVDGGTVSIIWKDATSGKIFFEDIHGSLSKILNEAKRIAAIKHVDPTIAISDAGIVSRKFRAENFVLDLGPIKKLAPHSLIAAGYGYVPIKYTVYEDDEPGKSPKLDTVREKAY